MTIEAELPRLAAGSTRDHVLLANTALVDRVDLATPLSLSSRPATGLSALAPAQLAGAQRLCALAQAAVWRCLLFRRCQETSRRPANGSQPPPLTQQRHR